MEKKGYTKEDINAALMLLREDKFMGMLMHQLGILHKHNQPIDVDVHYNGRVVNIYDPVVTQLANECRANMRGLLKNQYPAILYAYENPTDPVNNVSNDGKERWHDSREAPALGEYHVITEEGEYCIKAIFYPGNGWEEFNTGRKLNVIKYRALPELPKELQYLKDRK